MVRARDTDACPGALQVHQAADGALVRVRLPGGMITAAQLATLSGVSSAFGSGTLELTARGNVQLRGITDVTTVAEAIVPLLTKPGCCRRRRTSGSATSSRRRCPAGPAGGSTCAGGWASWTRRSAPSPGSPSWEAGSGSASTTAAPTCPAWAPMSACTRWTTVSRCCWRGGTPASGWLSATSPRPWWQSPCGSSRSAERLGG